MENKQHKVHQTVFMTTTTRTDGNGNKVVEFLYGVPSKMDDEFARIIADEFPNND